MPQRSIYSQYFRYTIPTVAAMLVNGLYQVIDGIFIGHYVGAAGLAAINVSWALTGSITGLGLLVGVGTGSLTSIRKGETRFQAARETLATGMMLLIALAVVIGLGLFLWGDTVLSWQTQDQDVLKLAQGYVDVLTFTPLFILGSIAIPFLMRNDESPQLATIIMMVGGALNILFDYLFIGVFDLKLFGAALATSIAQATVVLLGIWYFISPAARVRLTKHDWHFRWQELSNIIMIGLSSFFMYLYWGVMVAFHNTQFAQYGGTSVVAAYAILGYLVTFYYLTVEGIANGMQPLASFHFGAKHPHIIVKLLKLALSLALGLGITIVIAVNIWPDRLLEIFSDSREVINAGRQGIRWHLAALWLDGYLVVVAAFYQSTNQGKKAMMITLGNIIAQPPLLMLLPMYLSLTGVWLAFPVSNIILAVIVTFMLMKDVAKLNSSSDASGDI